MKKIYFLSFLFLLHGFSLPSFSQKRQILPPYMIESETFRFIGTTQGEIQLFDIQEKTSMPEIPNKTFFIGKHAITALALSANQKVLAVGTQDGFLFTISSLFSEKKAETTLKIKIEKPIAMIEFPKKDPSSLLVETIEPNQGRKIALLPLNQDPPKLIPFAFSDHERDISKTWFVAYFENDQVKILLPEEFTLKDFFLCDSFHQKISSSKILCHLTHID